MKHKKLIAIVTLLLFALTLFPSAAFAATPGTKVTATIPTFKVTMNGQVVDNTYRQYPFLVYNDITYFPMTYWDMRFLGVSNTWSAETGSVIVADGTSSEYKPTLTDVKNKTKNTAVVNTGAFKVNGKVIDNAKEQYPILSFRDVPYFPLTWSWCQEFGWNISFDGTNGLAVNTTKQTPSKNVNNEPATSNTTEVYKITADELQDSSWVADNTNSIEIWGFFRDDENGSENVYVHLRQTMDASNTIIRSLAVQEGSYILSNDSLILTQEKEETVTQDITGKESSASNDEKRTFTYSVKGVIKDGKQLIYIDGHPYYNMSIDETNDVLHNRQSQWEEQAESIIASKKPNSANVYKLTATELQSGVWIADHTTSFEYYSFDERDYTYVAQGVDNPGIIRLGNYVFSDGSLTLTQKGEEITVTETVSRRNFEKQTFSYNVVCEMKDGKLWMNFNDSSYYYVPLEEAGQVLETLMDRINELPPSTGESDSKPQLTLSEEYAYLAGNDFRNIQRQYSTAEAQCAYVYAYENIDGELCVLTYLKYKIISNYEALTLHNITTGQTISNPIDYYNNLAERYYGATKIYYWDLSSEIQGNHINMMKALVEVLRTGKNTFDGVFVDAQILNM